MPAIYHSGHKFLFDGYLMNYWEFPVETSKHNGSLFDGYLIMK
jgi:hypothetical protein